MREYKKVKDGARGPYRKYTYDDMEKALENVRNHEGTISDIAVRYGIPQRTLERKLKEGNYTKKPGHKFALTEEDELYLIEGLAIAGEYGFPLKREDVADIVEKFVKTRNIKTNFKNDRPGKDWLISFFKRYSHLITEKSGEILTKARAKSLTPEILDTFFTIFQNKVEELKLTNRRQQFWSADEIGFQTRPNNKRLIFRKGANNCNVLTPNEGKTSYTTLFCANGVGEFVDPYVVYKGTPEQLQDTWVIGGPPDAQYNVTKSGWMEDYVFFEWLKKCFLPKVKAMNIPFPQILLFDGHNSHISLKTLQYAKENDVHIICIPPHSSHVLQVLDVSVYKPAKSEWMNILRTWNKESGLSPVTKAIFPVLIKKLFQFLVKNPNNVVSGFKKTGLLPIDKSMIKLDKSTTETPRATVPPSAKMTPRKAMREAVTLTLAPQISPMTEEGLKKKNMKRTRVQKLHGECLTSEEALKRVAEEELRKAAKKSKKAKGGNVCTQLDFEVGEGSGCVKQQTKKAKEDLNKESLISNDVESISIEDIQVGMWVIFTWEGSLFPEQVLSKQAAGIEISCLIKSEKGKGWKFPPENKLDIGIYPIDEILSVIKDNQIVPINNRNVFSINHPLLKSWG